MLIEISPIRLKHKVKKHQFLSGIDRPDNVPSLVADGDLLDGSPVRQPHATATAETYPQTNGSLYRNDVYRGHRRSTRGRNLYPKVVIN